MQKTVIYKAPNNSFTDRFKLEEGIRNRNVWEKRERERKKERIHLFLFKRAHVRFIKKMVNTYFMKNTDIF